MIDRHRPPCITVVMPTHNRRAFIERAIDSLLAQSLADWELVIVDDGSTDGTSHVVQRAMSDGRIRYRRFDDNRGLGAALNAGLDLAQSALIAYLPSDDVYYRDHLATLAACLDQQPGAALAYSGVRHHYGRSAPGQIDGYPLQLVQVLHRAGPERWLERDALVTDDLERMLWSRLRERGEAVGTGLVTCEWVDHPHQLHKLLREPVGGINPYRVRFNVQKPLRFHTTVGNRIDEVEHYRRFRERPDTPPATDGLKILLVGELAYNAERVLALEERGHQLYGLWMPDPYWYNTVGPLPFGHVRDLPREGWRDAVRALKPDVIYALLSWQAVPFVHEVFSAGLDAPLVWHFKEGPFICLEQGMWPQLIDVHARADGQIFSSPEMQAWYDTIVPGLSEGTPSLVIDGDLPKREWFLGERSPRLSEQDGELHTVVPGRPIGLHPYTVDGLAQAGIHLHFYGDFTHGQWREWIEKARRIAPGHLHLHSQVDQEGWVAEFSQYDAGWLHFFESGNQGELRRANWDDLNYPARLATLAAAGLPMLQRDNSESLVATQTLVRDLDIGLFFSDIRQLAEMLHDEGRMARLRANIWRHRERFTFDYHADSLIDFFRHVIANRHK